MSRETILRSIDDAIDYYGGKGRRTIYVSCVSKTLKPVSVNSLEDAYWYFDKVSTGRLYIETTINTFPYKEELKKKFGCKFDPKYKEWYAPDMAAKDEALYYLSECDGRKQSQYHDQRAHYKTAEKRLDRKNGKGKKGFAS